MMIMKVIIVLNVMQTVGIWVKQIWQMVMHIVLMNVFLRETITSLVVLRAIMIVKTGMILVMVKKSGVLIARNSIQQELCHMIIKNEMELISKNSAYTNYTD